MIYRDEIVIYRVISADAAGSRHFLANLKEHLRREFKQEEILIIERAVGLNNRNRHRFSPAIRAKESMEKYAIIRTDAFMTKAGLIGESFATPQHREADVEG